MIYRIMLEDGSEITVKDVETASVRDIATSVGVDWMAEDVVVLSD